MSQATGSLLVAVDIKCYDRYPCEGKNSEENRETGIKWEKAVYLNPVLSQIDYKVLKEQYSGMEKRLAGQETDREPKGGRAGDSDTGQPE